jgi:hypothetical protein
MATRALTEWTGWPRACAGAPLSRSRRARFLHAHFLHAWVAKVSEWLTSMGTALQSRAPQGRNTVSHTVTDDRVQRPRGCGAGAAHLRAPVSCIAACSFCDSMCMAQQLHIATTPAACSCAVPTARHLLGLTEAISTLPLCPPLPATATAAAAAAVVDRGTSTVAYSAPHTCPSHVQQSRQSHACGWPQGSWPQGSWPQGSWPQVRPAVHHA